MGIVAANRVYERWLSEQLGGAVVKADLKTKHEKMGDNAFAFLRATYWRWAETILTLCPDLAGAPAVLAVGDTHLENFGTWRDEDGRLIWGVNDFDECAEMPYPLDLVRLATSAALALPDTLPLKTICASLLEGYKRGIEEPAAFVLDRDHLWLRKRFDVDEMRALASGARSPSSTNSNRKPGSRRSRRKAGCRCLQRHCRSLPSRSRIGRTRPAPAASAGRAGWATASGATVHCCAKARRWWPRAGRARMAADNRR